MPILQMWGEDVKAATLTQGHSLAQGRSAALSGWPPPRVRAAAWGAVFLLDGADGLAPYLHWLTVSRPPTHPV